MAQTIKLKRSASAGAIPSTSDLALGEIAINTKDGAVYIKKNDGSSDSIVAVHDNDILHIDTSNTRIGIGTTSPASLLTVAGDLRQTTGDYLYTGGGNFDIKHTIDDQNITFHTSASSSTSEKMRIKSDGTVGIGTASPEGTLHVKSSGNGEIDVERASGAKINLQAQASAGYIGTDSNHVFGLKANSTVRLKIATGGAITFNDAYTFPTSDGSANQVLQTDGSGTLTFATQSSGGSDTGLETQQFTGNGSTTAYTLTSAPAGEGDLLVFHDGAYQNKDSYSLSGTTLTFDTAPDNGAVILVHHFRGGIVGTAPAINSMTGDGSDTTLTLSTTPVSENATFVTIDGVVQHKSTYAVSGTTLTFSTAPPNGSSVECITFKQTEVATFEDADGDTKIQVEESSDEDIIRFDVAGNEFATMAQTSSEHYLRLFRRGTSAKSSFSFTGTGLITDVDSGYHSLIVKNNGTEQFRVKSDGSVGIGTTNPDKMLVVQGADAEVAISDTNSTPLLRFRENGTTASTIHTASGKLNFATKPSGGSITDHLTLDTDGNLGIGTTSPSYKLEVEGTTDFGNTTTYNNAAAGLISWNAGTKFKVKAASNHALSLGAGGTEDYLYILTDGKVGIGTTSPAQKLEVAGRIRATTDPTFEAFESSTKRGGIQWDSSNDYTNIFSVGGDIRFDMSGEKARINSSGSLLGGITSQVGIGSAASDANSFELGRGYLNLARDDTASAQQLQFSKNGSIHSYLETTTGGLTIGGSSVGINMNPSGYGKLSVNSTGVILALRASSGAGTLGFYEAGAGRFYLKTLNGADGLSFIDGDGSTEHMRIDANGKFIIGDTASHTDDLFQIETPASGGGHGIQIRRNDSNNDQGVGRIQFGNNTSTGLASMSAITDGATDNARLVFSTKLTSGSLTERMRISGGAATSSDADVIRTNSSVGIRSTHYNNFEFNNMGGHGSETNANIKKALKEAAFGSFNVNFDVGSYSNGLYYVGAGKGASTTNSYIKFKVSLSKATTMDLNHMCGNSADGVTRTMNIDYSFDDLNWTQAATGTFAAGTLDQSATLNFNTIGQHSIGGVFSGDIYIRFEFKGGSSSHDTLIGWRRLKLEAQAEDMQLVNPGGPGYGPVETAMFTQTSSSASNIVTNNSGFVDLAQSSHGGYMNPNIFELDNNGNYGVHIKRDGKVLVQMSQDFIDSTTSGYIASRIYRAPANDANNRVMSYQLAGHSDQTGQWEMLCNQASFDVNAGDRVQFYIAGTAITQMDSGNWSQYTITWIDSQHSGDANRAVATHQENAHFNF